METPSIQKIALKWGLILAGIAIVLSVASTQTMSPDGVGVIGTVISLLSFAAQIAIGVLAVREFRTLNGDAATLGEGFKTGFFTYAISSVISSIFSYINAAFIDPDLPQRMVDMTLGQLEANPAVQEGQMAMFEKIYGAMFSPGGQLLTGLIGGLIIGAIVALIIAAIMKREAPVDLADIDEIGG